MAFGKGAAKGNRFPEKARIWTEAIKRAMREECGSDWQQALTKAAKPLVKAALNGDLAALKEIGDRLEGKPHQTSEVTVTRVTNPNDLPTHELERIAFGGRDNPAETAGGLPGDNSVH